MRKALLLTFAFVFMLFGSAMAQRTVSGVVTDSEDGSPLPGVNVVIKGTSQGTVTDVDGKYQIKVENDQTVLVFSYVGYVDKEETVGARSVIDVALAVNATLLEGVVVTALGIEKDKKALGYAVSEISSEAINDKSEGDIGRLLRGKAAGVDIQQTSGVSGSATNIIIRGYTSISGSNQPLFVVDGVPFNANTNTIDNFQDGQAQSSRFLDIDPNSIESVSVLKGLAATVLYGDRGRNGVLLITTKNGASGGVGKKKTEITLTQSLFTNKIASLPDYQNNYGGGFYQNFGFFFSNWGPEFSEIETIAHPYSRFSDPDLIAAFPQFQAGQAGNAYEYRPYDNVEEFFRTGIVSTTSLNINGGGENTSFNANFGYLDDEGFTPGNGLRRANVGFGGRAVLSNKVTVSGTVNLAQTDFETPSIASSLGSGSASTSFSSVFGDLLYTPRSVDLNGLPYQNPLTGGSVYYRSGNDIQNPNWTVHNTKVSQEVVNIFGQAGIKYDITDKISANYRLGFNSYSEYNSNSQNKGGVDGNVLGVLQTTSVRNSIINHDLILNGQFSLTDDLKLGATVGVNARIDKFDRTGVFSSNQIVFGVAKHENFIDQSTTTETLIDLEREVTETRLGIYASAEFDYKSYLFVTLSGRNDISNTLEKGNNSIFYPGVSVAFDATTAIPAIQDSDVLSYLKFRVGYGTSAGFPIPYATRSTLLLNAREFVRPNNSIVASNSASRRLGNPDLTPERISEIEVGLESSLLNDRLGINLSLFQKTTQDLILDRGLDPATGFDVTQTNAGEMQVKGIEIDLNATVLQKGDFTWRAQGVFNSSVTRVIDLPDDADQINTAGFTNLGNFAIEGEVFGVIQGSAVARDDNGNRLVDATGQYIGTPGIQIIGNPNPDFTSSLTNTFSYKGLSLSIEWQYRHGGDIYSRTAANLVGRGITSDTDFDRRQSFILPGVTEDGQVNTTQIAATDLYFSVLGFGEEELKVYDGTTIRLNELSLSYALPKSMLEKTPFGNVSLTLSGYNLWFEAVNMPKGINFDTNVIGTGVGNGIGLDFLSGPSSKRFGGTLKLTF